MKPIRRKSSPSPARASASAKLADSPTVSATAQSITPSKCNQTLGGLAKRKASRQDLASLAQALALNSTLTGALVLANPDGFDANAFISDMHLHIRRPWTTVIQAHYQMMAALSVGNVAEAVRCQMGLVSDFLSNIFPTHSNAILPVAYTLLDTLGQLAVTADLQAKRARKPAEHLMRSMHHFQSAFASCMMDRGAVSDPTSDALDGALAGKLVGALRIVNIQMRLFFRAGQTQLIAKLFQNVEHRIRTSDTLAVSSKADLVTFRYWYARDCLLNDRVAEAERWAKFVLQRCPGGLVRHLQWILILYIPLQLIHGIFPDQELLSKYPALSTLCSPLCDAIRTCNLAQLNAHLQHPQVSRILTHYGLADVADALRWIVLRQVVKKVYLVKQKASRLSFDECWAAFKLSMGEEAAAEAAMAPSLEEEGERRVDWVEEQLGSLIAMGLVKGYVSFDHKLMVLSKADPFPPVADQVVRALELWDVWKRAT